MSRLTLAAVALAPALLLQAEEPAAPDAGQIAEWVKQLGSEEYAERRAALEKLRQAGEAAVEPLENALRSSDDLEVRNNAQAALPYARACKVQRVWKAAMQERWVVGLKEGRIEGPTLGMAPDLALGGADKVPARDGSNAAAVSGDNGLDWLSRTQEGDGHFDALSHGADYHADVENTALAVLAYLGAGHTEKVGAHKVHMQKAIAWLIEHQRADGAILNPGWVEVDGITHALAGLALAEAGGMGRKEATIAAAQKAVEYSINRHQCGEGTDRGGFGRLPKSAAPDLFTSTFFTMQLKSAKVAGLKVDPAGFDGLIKFLDAVDAKNAKDGGYFSYVPGGKPTPEATLMGCLARQFMGWKREDLAPQVTAAVQAFKGPSTGKDDSNVVANYFGTLAVFQQGGQLWKDWNTKMKQSLVEAQGVGGNTKGSWEASGAWSGAGRVFATAMNALCLEVYYRYLPMYKE